MAGRGGCVSTRGFRWAVACGDGLAVCTDVTTGDILDADALRKAAVEAVQARGDSDEEVKKTASRATRRGSSGGYAA